MVRRLFVEKRPGFDIPKIKLSEELRDALRLSGGFTLRLFNRYDIEGLDDEYYTMSKNTIFSEPNTDLVYDESLPPLDGFEIFAIEYLPGQYDQRADSAAQCVQLLTKKERPAVACAKVIAISGPDIKSRLSEVRDYMINPVESRPASLEKPLSLKSDMPEPENVRIIKGFIKMDEDALRRYHSEMGFAMSLQDLIFCRDYFKGEHRDPTVTELRVIDTYWSDHCRHTTFLTKLSDIEIEPGYASEAVENALKAYFEARAEVYGERIDKKDVCLMDMATMGMKLLKKRGLIPDLDESDEINACSIEVPVEVDGRREQWLVQFKNETHNHPTEIEPFGGAATCLGGAIRDPLSGRAYVYQAMRVTGSGDPTAAPSETLPGKLPQKKITTGAAAGYSSYGNQIGLSTGQVTELYDPGYIAKRMEIGAVIGASKKENVVRETPLPGDMILLIGGRTGRDGCGGATGSSKAHDTSSLETCGAEVQKGNPPTERKLQRLFRNPEAARMIKRCNDFGAGGVCVAIGELADSLDINLDLVTKKYEGIDGTELAISESQERMAVVLDPADADRFIELADSENLEATAVAKVTGGGRMRMNWRGECIVDLSRGFLNTNGVTQRASALIKAPNPKEDYRARLPEELYGKTGADAFLANLARLNVCSGKGLSERFDSSIGASTVLMPFVGKYQLTPEPAMVAKLPTGGKTDDATAMSYGFIPGIAKYSPFHGAVYAVLESLVRLACVGADPLAARLTFQEYFERLYGRPERWGKPAAALLGAFTAQKELGVPSIGGKDSMSGSFEGLDVPPTLVSFAVSMTKASATVSCIFKNTEDPVYLIELPVDKSIGLPDFADTKRMLRDMHTLIRDGKITAACPVAEGGAAAAVVKMALGDAYGFDFAALSDIQLYAPLAGSVVVQAPTLSDIECLSPVLLGHVNAHGTFSVGGEKIEHDKILNAYTGTLEKVFPTNSGEKAAMRPDIPLFSSGSIKAPAIKTAVPKVYIPVFPGTNCEYDSARAFSRAGAEPVLQVIRNLTPEAITESVREMVKKIDAAQMIMIPGGFSAGDEPDGSGKFIATVFRNDAVKDAVNRLLYQRDGLMLGICNGFQALIKLGLVPYGEIKEQSADAPTLTFNTLGHHVSCMAYTRVTSKLSPWLSKCKPGEVYAVPVSHGEGRFAASPEEIKTLSDAGQIATQYCDINGNPTGDIRFNINGSVCAVEGITSPDGRIFGRMGHSERNDDNCYKNVPGIKNQLIFESGVEYFKI